MAAREGHSKVVELLLKLGADATAQNFDDETALDVASNEMRRLILGREQVTEERRDCLVILGREKAYLEECLVNCYTWEILF